MALAGLCANEVRLPLTRATEATERELASVLGTMPGVLETAPQAA